MIKKVNGFILVLSFFFITSAQAEILLSMGVSHPGGSWYAAGGTITDIITNSVEGVTATAQTTGGAISNIKLLGTKDIDLCITINVIARSASKGKRPFKDAYTNIRSLLPNMEAGVLQIFTLAGSDINYVSELKGRKVMVGPQGHGSLIRLRQILGVMGFGFKDLTAVYLPFQQAMTTLGDRKVEAAVLYMSFPAPIATQFATTHGMKLLRFKEQYRKAVLNKFPFYLERVIPEGTYKGQNKAVPTLGTGNGIYISSDVSDETAYKVTKAIFEKLDRVRASHPSMRNISLKTATQGALVEFHPGVIKYYKEKGVWTGQ